jgi:hypothetical protein
MMAIRFPHYSHDSGRMSQTIFHNFINSLINYFSLPAMTIRLPERKAANNQVLLTV